MRDLFIKKKKELFSQFFKFNILKTPHPLHLQIYL